jgi:hypothetical protein
MYSTAISALHIATGDLDHGFITNPSHWKVGTASTEVVHRMHWLGAGEMLSIHSPQFSKRLYVKIYQTKSLDIETHLHLQNAISPQKPPSMPLYSPHGVGRRRGSCSD